MRADGKRFFRWFLVLLIAGASFGVLVLMRGADDSSAVEDSGEGLSPTAAQKVSAPEGRTVVGTRRERVRMEPIPDAEDVEEDEDAVDETADEEEELTEEERAEEDAERRVDAFDALTDKWEEPLPKDKRVTMEQIDGFLKQFKELPEERKEECLQRALNLIPDENVMVLAGVLLDKTEEADYAELIFQDVLNRDEDYKVPILKEIHKDKTHPCWEEADWLLKVMEDDGTLSAAESEPAEV